MRAMSSKLFVDSRAMRSKRISWFASPRVLPPETMVMTTQICCVLFLVILTIASIRGLNNSSLAASSYWILYEVYIIFDHIPFLFTRELYASPKFNFEHVPLTLFWGMEASASIVGCFSSVGAPYILLYNVVPHLAFIYANNIKQAACSYAFIPDSTGHKKWHVCLQVFVDNLVHFVSLWYHLLHLRHQVPGAAEWCPSPVVSWLCLLTFASIVTTIVHKRHMRLAYFVEDFSRTVVIVARLVNCRTGYVVVHAVLVGIQAYLTRGMMKSHV